MLAFTQSFDCSSYIIIKRVIHYVPHSTLILNIFNGMQERFSFNNIKPLTDWHITKHFCSCATTEQKKTKRAACLSRGTLSFCVINYCIPAVRRFGHLIMLNLSMCISLENNLKYSSHYVNTFGLLYSSDNTHILFISYVPIHKFHVTASFIEYLLHELQFPQRSNRKMFLELNMLKN